MFFFFWLIQLVQVGLKPSRRCSGGCDTPSITVLHAAGSGGQKAVTKRSLDSSVHLCPEEREVMGFPSCSLTDVCQSLLRAVYSCTTRGIGWGLNSEDTIVQRGSNAAGLVLVACCCWESSWKRAMSTGLILQAVNTSCLEFPAPLAVQLHSAVLYAPSSQTQMHLPPCL